MRTYEKTHPWLRFQADLQGASWRFWAMLGECQSKIEHVAGVPLQPQTARQLYGVYLAKGALSTTAIEGNTLSEQEAEELIQGTLKLPPSRQYLAREVENVIEACKATWKDIEQGEDLRLTPGRIRNLNSAILKGLEVEEGVVPGAIRSYSAVVGRYRGAPPEDCDYLLNKMCEWLEETEFHLGEENKIILAILKSVLAHLYLAWIHPFGDGNGRTARLVEFEILLRAGVPAPCAHLLSNHYNRTRTRYYMELDRASKSGGEVLPFLSYAIAGLRDELAQQIDVIRRQQMDVAWRNFVHEQFRDLAGESHTRRRRLVLDLSHRDRPIARSELKNVSPRIARAYATKTEKTLTRDLNWLTQMELLRKTEKGYEPCSDIILAIQPPRNRRADVRRGSHEPSKGHPAGAGD